MLVLSRQRDETIMIGDDIEVTVVDIRGDKVRLGINAPKEISVHRKEVYDAIKKENPNLVEIAAKKAFTSYEPPIVADAPAKLLITKAQKERAEKLKKRLDPADTWTK